jgi:hypothetical protein
MHSRPRRLPQHNGQAFLLEALVNDALRIGKHYAAEFARLAALSIAIQQLLARRHDSTSLIDLMRTIADETRSNLQLELDQLQRLREEVLPELETHAAVTDGIEPCALAPGTRTPY